MLFVVFVFMLQTPMQPAHGARSNDNQNIGTGPDLTSEPLDVKDSGERQMAANSKCPALQTQMQLHLSHEAMPNQRG